MKAFYKLLGFELVNVNRIEKFFGHKEKYINTLIPSLKYQCWYGDDMMDSFVARRFRALFLQEVVGENKDFIHLMGEFSEVVDVIEVFSSDKRVYSLFKKWYMEKYPN